MGWIGKLFGTQKAMDDLLDTDNGHLTKVGGWIGNLHYTEEEKAEAAAETRKWGLEHLQALAPFKVVQRVIAFTVMGLWSFVGVNLVVAIWVQAVTGIDAVTTLKELAFSDYVFWPTVSVLGLYMSGGVVPHIFQNKGK